MKKNIFFSFFSLLFLFTAQAQTITPRQLLKKVDQSLQDINSVTYKIDKTNKFFSSHDTLRRTAMCSLYVDSKDEMNAYHILDIKYDDDEYGHFKYDGSYTSSFSYHTDSLDVSQEVSIVNVLEDNHNSIVGTHINNYLLNDFFGSQNPMKQARSLLAKIFFIKEMTVEESTHLGTPVYVLTIYAKNKKSSDYVQNAVNKYYIRKSDFLPIAYSFYGEFEGMKEYEYFDLEYLSINPDIPLEAFKVDNTKTVIQPKEVKDIYENVKKYGL